MTEREFCYWLQGHFEIDDANLDTDGSLNYKQVRVIRDHLELAMKKVTPDRGKLTASQISSLRETLPPLSPLTSGVSVVMADPNTETFC